MMTTLFYCGLVLNVIGSIWLIALAVSGGRSTAEKLLWAVVNFPGFQPIGGIIFFIVRRTGLIPLLIVLAGFVIMLVSYYSMMRGMIGTIPV